MELMVTSKPDGWSDRPEFSPGPYGIAAALRLQQNLQVPLRL